MKSRFEQPIELVANQHHGWLLIFLALSVIWGVIRLAVNRPLLVFLMPGFIPIDTDTDEKAELFQPGLLQLVLSLLIIIPIAYFCSVEIPTPEWIESAANLIPEYLCWLLVWILLVGTWYVVYYIVFLTLEEPQKGIIFITSNAVIWLVPALIGVPLMLFHQYQPELLDSETVHRLLLGLLVLLLTWKVIIHSILIWFRLNVPAVYRFLYLCTLEILPVAVLLKLSL